MHGRRILTGFIAFALAGVAIAGAGAASASARDGMRSSTTATATPATQTAATQAAVTKTMTLAQIIDSTPKAPPLYVGYTGVEQFIPKAVAMKKDRNGCILRQRMLMSLATIRPKVAKGCRMTGGTWTIDNGAKTVKSPKGIAVVPVVPYKAAWGQGAYAWTPAQRLAFATNTGPVPSLRGKAIPITSTQNLISAKLLADTSAVVDIATCTVNPVPCFLGKAFATMLSSQNEVFASNVCWKVATSVGTLNRWGLSVDPSLAAALEVVRGKCAQEYSLGYEAAKYGIIPVAPTSAVPVESVPEMASIVSDYVEPVGDPVRGLFGMMAPPAWPAPPTGAVPTQALRLWDSSVSWADLQPSVYDEGSTVPKKSSINYARMDAAIARATELGARVVYVLGNTPGWANGGKPGNVPPTNLQDAADFVGALCSRYQGSIAEYEVWNEGNIVDFWSGTPDQLADLTARVHSAVKSCFPPATVIASSAGARAEGGLANRYRPYLDALASRGWPVDAFAVHSYPKADGGPMDRVGILQQWKAMLSSAGAPEKPLYDSELNYGLGGLGQPRMPIDDARGARYILQSLAQSVQYGIDGVDWFVWSGDHEDDKVGIQFTLSTTAQQQAWKTGYDWLNGARMSRCTIQNGAVHACQLRRANGTNATILWTVDDSTKDVTVKGLGHFRVCRGWDPCETYHSAVERLEISGMPVMLN